MRDWTKCLLIAIPALGTVMYALQASLPLWWDELYTVASFVRPGPLHAWFHHYHTNNHLLFTFAAWASSQVLGPTDLAYKLPALFAAVAALWAGPWLLTRTCDRTAAVSFALILVASPLCLYWLPQARGYGMAFLASVLVLSAALMLVARHGGSRKAAIGLLFGGGVLGVATLPHFAFLFTLVCATVVCCRLDHWRAVVAAWAGAGLLTAAFWAPAGLGTMARRTGSKYGPAVDGLDAIIGPVKYQVLGTLKIGGSLDQAVGPVLAIVLAAILVGLLAAAVIDSVRTRRWHALAIAVVPLHGTYLVIVLLSGGMTDRTLAFTFPFLALWAALGVSAMLRPGATSGWIKTGAASLITLAGVGAVGANLALALNWSSQPIEAFGPATELVAKSNIGNRVTDSKYPLAFRLYLPDIGLAERNEMAIRICHSNDAVAYIAHNFRQPRSPQLRRCLRRRGAVAVNFDQRVRGSITVWFVPATRGAGQ